jgi:hypothetical protein
MRPHWQRLPNIHRKNMPEFGVINIGGFRLKRAALIGNDKKNCVTNV